MQGFLPENIDTFIVDYVYPSYSIQVGIVFASSTAYSLWKVSAGDSLLSPIDLRRGPCGPDALLRCAHSRCPGSAVMHKSPWFG